ncbi:MAG: YihA family ribosome biogenesis GTP-binding protein, partial [Bacteroidia bacterium]|nr:YihA family ribosome biogenesis GTP-binding protein [Bacteroidia bacterium]
QIVLDANVEAFKEKLFESWEQIPEYFITSAETKLGREELLGWIENIQSTKK